MQNRLVSKATTFTPSSVDKIQNKNFFHEIDPSGSQNCEIILYKNPSFDQEKSTIQSITYSESETLFKQMEHYSDGYAI